jgi:hypothetical protein
MAARSLMQLQPGQGADVIIERRQDRENCERGRKRPNNAAGNAVQEYGCPNIHQNIPPFPDTAADQPLTASANFQNRKAAQC